MRNEKQYGHYTLKHEKLCRIYSVCRSGGVSMKSFQNRFAFENRSKLKSVSVELIARSLARSLQLSLSRSPVLKSVAVAVKRMYKIQIFVCAKQKHISDFIQHD